MEMDKATISDAVRAELKDYFSGDPDLMPDHQLDYIIGGIARRLWGEPGEHASDCAIHNGPARNIRIELSLYNRIAARAQEQRRSATQVAAMLLEGALAEPVREARQGGSWGVSCGDHGNGAGNVSSDPPK
jgi:hypothetical protein